MSGDELALDREVDYTPRPRRRHSQAFDVPAIPLRSSSKRTRSSATSSQAASSRHSIKSSSPTKVGALRGLEKPVILQTISSEEGWEKGLPEELVVLVRQTRYFSYGIGAVPKELENAIKPSLGLAWNENMISASDLYKKPPSVIDLDRVTRHTRRYAELGESEAAWNSAVHHFLGLVALECGAYESVLDFNNITSARISSRELLPLNADGHTISSKMVDFAITLKPTKEMGIAFRHTKPIVPGRPQSYNQTDHLPVANRPIAVSIETKQSGEGQQAAYGQLSTWLLAQYQRLRFLTEEAGNQGVTMPLLPVLVVQGPTWSLLAAKQNEEGEVILWDCGTFGESKSRLGVCQILATLLLLMRWSQEEYRAWFEEHALCKPK